MTAVDAVRLRADPVPVPLADGQEGGLRFSLLSLSLLEEDFGSFAEAWAQLNVARNGDAASRLSTKLATIAGSFLRAGLSDLGDIWTRERAQASVECSVADALELCSQALARAFPEPDGQGNGEAAEASLGETSITPPPSDGDAPTPSSGP